MSQGFPEVNLPPELLKMFEKQQDKIRSEHIEAMAAAEVASRQLVLDYAWLLCKCRPWYDNSGDPPQSGCQVHGTVMVTLDGRVL